MYIKFTIWYRRYPYLSPSYSQFRDLRDYRLCPLPQTRLQRRHTPTSDSRVSSRPEKPLRRTYFICSENRFSSSNTRTSSLYRLCFYVWPNPKSFWTEFSHLCHCPYLPYSEVSLRPRQSHTRSPRWAHQPPVGPTVSSTGYDRLRTKRGKPRDRNGVEGTNISRHSPLPQFQSVGILPRSC